jgi:hypothetical protein
VNATDDVQPVGAGGEPAAAKVSGLPGRKVGDLDAFKSAGGIQPPSASGGPAPGGRKGAAKKPVGRPPKNAAGFSAKAIEEVAGDPEVEAARAEFEAMLVHLLASTTDSLADSRFEILKGKFPAEYARGLADKARLTEKEKTYFGQVAIRLWRKYLGDKYLFSDEGIAGAYLLQYLLRNLEAMNQVKKIKAEINGKNDKRPGVPGAPGAGDRHERNGKIDARGAADLHAPGVPGPDL